MEKLDESQGGAEIILIKGQNINCPAQNQKRMPPF
jgi:hypothetical protein